LRNYRYFAAWRTRTPSQGTLKIYYDPLLLPGLELSPRGLGKFTKTFNDLNSLLENFKNLQKHLAAWRNFKNILRAIAA
jgi:hypothetical protein